MNRKSTRDYCKLVLFSGTSYTADYQYMSYKSRSITMTLYEIIPPTENRKWPLLVNQAFYLIVGFLSMQRWPNQSRELTAFHEQQAANNVIRQVQYNKANPNFFFLYSKSRF